MIDAPAVQRGVELSGAQATPEMWWRALTFYLAGLGITVALNDALTFFALNWGGLHRLDKLGPVAGGLVLSASYAATVGLGVGRGTLALAVATVLVGPSWVIFGRPTSPLLTHGVCSRFGLP